MRIVVSKTDSPKPYEDDKLKEKRKQHKKEWKRVFSVTVNTLQNEFHLF